MSKDLERISQIIKLIDSKTATREDHSFAFGFLKETVN